MEAPGIDPGCAQKIFLKKFLKKSPPKKKNSGGGEFLRVVYVSREIDVKQNAVGIMKIC